MPIRPRLRSWLLISGKLIITGSLLAFLSRKIPYHDLAAALNTITPAWLIAALGLVGLCTALVGVRWWLLLHTQDITISLGQAVLFTFIGQFFNSFLLGSTGGDAARVLYVVRVAPTRKTEAALTVALDRFVGLGVLLVYALLAIGLHSEFLAQSKLGSAPLVFAASLAGLCAAFSAMIYKPLGQLPFLNILPWPTWALGFFEDTYKMGSAFLARPLESAKILMMAALIHLIVFFAGYGLARAFGMQVTLVDMMLILPIVFCASSIPVTMSGFGVREGLFVYLFGLAGIINRDSESALAIAYSIIWYALGLFWSLVGGCIFLLAGKNVR